VQQLPRTLPAMEGVMPGRRRSCVAVYSTGQANGGENGTESNAARTVPHKSLIVGESDLDVDTRDNFAFWAPLDQQYISTIFELANQGSLEYLSAFNTGELYFYEPYNALPCVPVYPAVTPSQNQTCDISILNAVANNVQSALGAGQISSTGSAYQAEIASYWVAH
jgi:hypothetical protein